MAITVTKTGVTTPEGLVQVRVESDDPAYVTALYVPAGMTRAEFVTLAGQRLQQHRAALQQAAQRAASPSDANEVRQAVRDLLRAFDALDDATTQPARQAARAAIRQARDDLQDAVARLQ